MKGKILLVLLLLAIPGILAQNISVNYPSEVALNEEFTFSINLIDFDSGTYDVKIDLISAGERIAQIQNDGNWKSTYYYINGAIDEVEIGNFRLRVLEDFENADIEIKIRDASGSSSSFSGYSISKKPGEAIDEEPETIEDDNAEEVTQDPTPYNEDVFVKQKPYETQIFEDGEEEIEENRIILQGKSINSEKKTEDLSGYALYGFFVFTLLIATIFLYKGLNSKRYKNEFG